MKWRCHRVKKTKTQSVAVRRVITSRESTQKHLIASHVQHVERMKRLNNHVSLKIWQCYDFSFYLLILWLICYVLSSVSIELPFFFCTGKPENNTVCECKENYGRVKGSCEPCKKWVYQWLRAFDTRIVPILQFGMVLFKVVNEEVGLLNWNLHQTSDFVQSFRLLATKERSYKILKVGCWHFKIYQSRE